MRKEVVELLKLGPLPDSSADLEQIGLYEDLIVGILPPLTNEEACALVGIFGPDECYGLSWSLISLIETAPDWPIEGCLEGDNEWVTLLRTRINNAKLFSSNKSKTLNS